MWTNSLPPELLNTVHCIDCLEFMKTLPDNTLDLCVVDPPYWMSYVSSRRKHKHEEIKDDDNLERVPEWIAELYRIQKDNTHAYIFCNDYWIQTFREEAKKVWYTAKRTLVWIKNNHTSGDLEWDYANITEFCVFLHKWRKELNWWRDRNTLYFDREDCTYHPTVKSKELMKYLISKSSDPGDVCFDCFAWSWTTWVACKELWRNYILVEKEPKYVDIIHKRLQNTTVSLFHS